MQAQGQDSQSFDMNEMSQLTANITTRTSRVADELGLREHLLAAQAAGQAQVQQQPQTPEPLRPIPPPGNPHEHNIDPAIAPHGYGALSPGESGRETSPDGKRGAKRELSTSKRAAQNRAAQRAFRQRKEGYIKKLEEQVRDFHVLEESFKQIQAENYSLRDYVINLQSRLIEKDGEYPQPPPSIDLQNPREPHVPHIPPPTAPMGQSAVSQLQAAAAAAAAGEMVDSRSEPDESPREYREDSAQYARATSESRTDEGEEQSRGEDVSSSKSGQPRNGV